MLDKDFEHFMTTTMKAHCLQVWSLYDARNLLWRGATYWDAKELFEQGRTLFERKDIIIDPENYAYPPKSALVPSFKKWLALQKHDINAVNSLYLYEQAVRDRIWFVQEGIYDLEEMLETLPDFVMWQRIISCAFPESGLFLMIQKANMCTNLLLSLPVIL